MYLPIPNYKGNRNNNGPGSGSNSDPERMSSPSSSHLLNIGASYGLPHTIASSFSNRVTSFVGLGTSNGIGLPHLPSDLHPKIQEQEQLYKGQTHYPPHPIVNPHLQPLGSLQRQPDILHPYNQSIIQNHALQPQIQLQLQQQQHHHHHHPHHQIAPIHQHQPPQLSFPSPSRSPQIHSHYISQYSKHQSNQRILPNVHQLVKKKRGRPKKLILDPSTNEYIDSSHPHYKQLNKTLKEPVTNMQMSSSLPHHSIEKDTIAKSHGQPTSLLDLSDDAVQKLIQRKDKRGRPRKFPIEETGLTIKGIRVNGISKQRKKKEIEVTDNEVQRLKCIETAKSRILSESSSTSTELRSEKDHLSPEPVNDKSTNHIS